VIASALGYYAFAPDSLRPLVLKSDFERFCLSCEDTLKQRLRSPSSYIRTECKGPYTETATVARYLEYDPSKKSSDIDEWVKAQIERGELNITTAYLNYEAANGFGASIRGLEACEIDHRPSETLIEATRYLGPHVGGYDKTGWIIQQLKAQP